MNQICSFNQQFNKLLQLTSYTLYSCALLSDICCIVLKKNSSVHISFLVGFDVWMILSFLFLPVLAFMVCFLQLIPLIVVFNSFWKMKNHTSLSFPMHWFLSKLTNSQLLFSEISFWVSLPPQQKMVYFYTYNCLALLISSDHSNPGKKNQQKTFKKNF